MASNDTLHETCYIVIGYILLGNLSSHILRKSVGNRIWREPSTLLLQVNVIQFIVWPYSPVPLHPTTGLY
jgi:hypothetical protein